MPILAFSAFMIIREALVQRNHLLDQISAATFASSQATDIEARRLETMANTLAQSYVLKRGDFVDFYNSASAAVRNERGARIVLYDKSGQAILATNRPFEAQSTPGANPQETVQRVLETKQAQVSGLFTARMTKLPSLAVFVPVTENGEPLFVVGVIFPPAIMSEIVKHQLVLGTGRGVLFDGEGIVIARTVDEQKYIGHQVSPDTRRAMLAGETSFNTINLDGVSIRAALVTSPFTGWSTSYGIDTKALNGPLWQALWQFGGGAGLCIVAALGLALYHSRQISGPVLALGRMAHALAHGESIPEQQLGFVEAQITADAIRDVAAELKGRVADRERTVDTMRRERDLLAYYAISSAAEQNFDLVPRLEGCLRAATEAFGMAAGAIHLLTTSDGCLRLRAVRGLSENYVDEFGTVQPGEDIAAIISVENTIAVLHTESCPTGRLRALAETEGIRTLVGVPLLSLQKVVGVLTLGSGVERTFQPDERLLLGAIGHQIGAYIDHATQYETALIEIAEREKIQRQLETAHQELETFSYSVSHDLRSPLRAVNGFSRALLEDYGDKLGEEGRRLATVVCDSAKRMAEMIDEILTFSQIGRAAMAVAPVDMQKLVRKTIDELTIVTQGRQINFDVQQLPPALGDTAMVQLIWVNLLSNAVKYTAPKECAIIEVGAEVSGEKTIYFVRDNGVGFDMRYLDKLFGTFQRLHGSEFPGTGVGLSIVKRIVTRHGGSVWAEAAVDKGAAFFFSIGGVVSKPPADVASPA